MTTFEERKKAQEAKFKRSADLRFKADARQIRLFGLWAAGVMGRDDPAAYAAGLVAAKFAPGGHANVFNIVYGNLQSAGMKVAETELHAKLEEFKLIAEEQVADEA